MAGQMYQPLLEHDSDADDLVVSEDRSAYPGHPISQPLDIHKSPGLSPGASPGRNGSEELKKLKPKRGATKVLREARPRRQSMWLCINQKAIRTTIHADKRTLIQKFDLGIPIRDMRLVDHNLLTSETGKILVRDNAIVFSFEYVRLIIAADRVFIPKDGIESNEATARFVEKLEDTIIEADRENSLMGLLDEEYMEGKHTVEEEADGEGAAHQAQQLPFELVVFEAALNDVCSTCATAAKELEALVVPALDALLKKVSKSGLERIRKLKARHQRLNIRVKAVRDELERFLNDDDDLYKFCLTRKKEVEAMLRSQRLQPPDVAPQSLNRVQSQQGASLRSRGGRGGLPGSPPTWDPHALQATNSISYAGHVGMFGQDDADADAVEAVENLLESYFMYIDNAYDKVVSLDEYIKDTEEFIDIDLDWNRNRLIKLEIMLTAATFAIAPFNLVAGILGENVKIPEFLATEDFGALPFWALNLLTCLFCTCFFTGIVLYTKWLKIL